jgi:hypothetical protein
MLRSKQSEHETREGAMLTVLVVGLLVFLFACGDYGGHHAR